MRIELYELSRRFRLHEILKRSLFEKMIDSCSEVLPHPVKTARFPRRALRGSVALRMERSVVADDLKGVSLNCVKDIFEGDLSWRSQEFISTLWSSYALNDVTFS